MLVITELLLFIATALTYLRCFKTEEGWSAEVGLGALRYFTLLSNLFSAFTALATALTLLRGPVPFSLWLCRYVSVASVTVTLLTVLFFLGPALGYKSQLTGVNLFFHFLLPLLAIAVFCFFERFYPLTFPLSLFGIVPVAVYGLVYLYKVVYAPPEKRWEDFYGFDKNGKWQIAFLAMHAGAALVCVLLWLLCRLS